MDTTEGRIMGLRKGSDEREFVIQYLPVACPWRTITFGTRLLFVFVIRSSFFLAVAIIPIFVDADLNQKEREMNKRK